MKKTFSIFSIFVLIALSYMVVSISYAQNIQPKPLLNLAAEIKSKAVTEEAAIKVKELIPPKVANKTKETADKKTHWSYQGDGRPAFWGELADEYATCKTGKNQSPVNISDRQAVGTTGLNGFDVFYRDSSLKILNNGRSLQVNYSNGSYIMINEHRYNLLQFNFHTPSEHQLNGVNYPMEMQLLHKNAQGNLAVISILFQEGKANKMLQRIIRKAPKQKSEEKLYFNVIVNPNLLFPIEKMFYKYNGSLTTPPCTQGVYWMVFKQPIEASALQLRKMSQIMGQNNRPVQKHFARTILKSWQEGVDTSNTGMYEFY